ncbi:hypothetical protein EG831_10545 [bacterium]|nr:hypothetical protein [bacterium]
MLITLAWSLLLAAVLAMLAVPASREAFVAATRAHPLLLGMAKFALLGTMGELLSWKVVTGRWRFSGMRLPQRVLAWACYGVLFTLAFPLFSHGVDGMLAQGLLPGRGVPLLASFWKSFFMQFYFAFLFMSFHRLVDTLIDRGLLFRRWPVVDTFLAIDWGNMIRVVGWSLVWFWLPVQTLNYLLPPEYRVVTAALLAIALGLILGIAKRMSAAKKP